MKENKTMNTKERILKNFDENYYDEGQFEADVHDRQRKFISDVIDTLEQECLQSQLELLEEIKKEFENPESERFGDTYSFERGKSVGRNELKREQIELLDSKILSIKKDMK